jgi:hypothetical protein
MADTALIKKLQLKGRPLVLLNLPGHLDSFFPEEAFRAEAMPKNAGAVLGFAENREELDKLIRLILPQIDPDAILWLAYPKKTPKRYQSDITRDHGWGLLTAYHYEPVRQIALDEDWSALRFKPFALIDNPVRKEKMIKEDE